MLKLKGQAEYGEWVEFNISQVYDVCLYDNRWYIRGYPNDYIIDAATIQPADDPRKAMLEEIRQLIERLSPRHGWYVMLDKLLPALDEMEAKL